MNKANKPTAYQPVDIDEVICNLKALHSTTTQGAWSKGDTSHETVVVTPKGKEYHIASFRHADDASFVDYVHAHLPAVLAEIQKLRDQLAVATKTK